ncbi:MAG: hypothetical protein K8R19_01270, partial [Methanosarcinales archaeon]|nr:hypothetical protein [Methanosarcinales archaeon]
RGRFSHLRGLFIYKNPPVTTFTISTIASKAIKNFSIVSVLLFAVWVILHIHSGVHPFQRTGS